MKYHQLITIALLLITINISCKKEPSPEAQKELHWSETSSYPGEERTSPVSFAINNKAYVGLGIDFLKDTSYADLWCFSPEEDTWSRLIDCPEEYVTGIYSSCTTDTSAILLSWNDARKIVEYLPATDTWLTRTTVPYSINISQPRIFCLNDELYIFDIQSGNLISWNPLTDEWSEKNVYNPFSVHDSEAIVIDNTAYVFICTGLVVEIYQFNGNVLSLLSEYPLSEQIYNISFIHKGIGNSIYFGRGGTISFETREAGTFVSDYKLSTEVWQFDTETNLLTSIVDFAGTKRMFGASFCINDEIYFGMGCTVTEPEKSAVFLNDFWKFAY